MSVACGYCALFIVLKARFSTRAAVSGAPSSSSPSGCRKQAATSVTVCPPPLLQVLAASADRYAVWCVLAGFVGWLMSVTREQYIAQIARILDLPSSRRES